MTKPKSHIFCPNCGAGNEIEQNFCRYCGLNLRETSKSLLTQLSADKEGQELKRLKRAKKMSDAVSIGLWAALTAGALFYIYVILTKMVLSGERVAFGLILIFMALQFVARRYRKMKYVNRPIGEEAKTNPLSPNELRARETTKLPEADLSEIASASVTENTTRVLSFESKTRKLE